jgi:hypothetical protein
MRFKMSARSIVNMATYKALTDLWLPGGIYAEAGDLINDTGSGVGWPVPATWIPPAQAVDPLDNDALNKYFAAGPQLCSEQPFMTLSPWNQQNGRWEPVFKSSTHWYRAVGSHFYYLRNHEELGGKLPPS